MNTNNEEIKIIKKNINLSIIFLLSIIISIIISYNEKLYKENKKTLFNNTTSKNLNLTNRVLALLLVIGFLIINYEEYNIGKMKNKNLKPLKHQLLTSVLNIISASLALYIVIENMNQNFQVFNIENPTV